MLVMFYVVLAHLLGNAEHVERIGFGGAGYFAHWFVSGLCHAANPCFILISAFFMVELPFRASRLLRLWLMVLFYTLFGTLAAHFVFHTPLDLNALLYAFFPITRSAYWFTTQYFLLLAISPFLNKFIHSLSKKELIWVIAVLGVLFSIIPTFLYWSQSYFSKGFDLHWLVLVYFLGAYIRLYGLDVPKGALWYLVSCVFLSLSRLVIGTLAFRFTGSPKGAGLFFLPTSPVFIFMGVCLFSAFQKLKVTKGTKLINKISSCMIGVYLLHMQKYLDLRNRVGMAETQNAWTGILWALLMGAVLYLLGIGVEAARKQFARLYREKALCRWLDEKTAKLLPAEQM